MDYIQHLKSFKAQKQLEKMATSQIQSPQTNVQVEINHQSQTISEDSQLLLLTTNSMIIEQNLLKSQNQRLICDKSNLYYENEKLKQIIAQLTNNHNSNFQKKSQTDQNLQTDTPILPVIEFHDEQNQTDPITPNTVQTDPANEKTANADQIPSNLDEIPSDQITDLPLQFNQTDKFAQLNLTEQLNQQNDYIFPTLENELPPENFSEITVVKDSVNEY